MLKKQKQFKQGISQIANILTYMITTLKENKIADEKYIKLKQSMQNQQLQTTSITLTTTTTLLNELNSVIMNKLSSKQTQIKSLKQTIRLNVESHHSEVQKLTKQIAGLGKITKVRNILSSSLNQVNLLQAVIKQKEQNINSLEEVFKEMKQSFIQTINSKIQSSIQLTQLKQQNSNLKKLFDQQKFNASKFIAEITAIKQRLTNQITSLQLKNSQLQKEKLAKIQQITELKATKQSLINEIPSLKTTVSSLKLQNEKLKVKIIQLEAINSQLNKNNAEIKSSNEKKITELTSENKHLLSSVEFQKGKNEINVKQIQKLQGSSKKVTDQKINLQISVQKLKSQIDNRTKQYNELKESIKILKDDFMMKQMDFDEKIQKQQEINRKNQQQITTMNELLTEQKLKIEIQIKQIEGLEKQNDGLKRENRSKDQQIISLEKIQDEKIKLDTKLIELSIKLNALQKNVEQTGRETVQMGEKIRTKLKEQIQRLSPKQSDRQNNDKKSLQAIINKISSKNSADLSNVIIEIIQKLQRQIESSKQGYKSKTQELQNLKKETQKRSFETDRYFKQEKEKMQVEVNKNVIIIQDLREQLSFAQNKIIKLEKRARSDSKVISNE